MSYRFPVSIKGVVLYHGKVILLKNERDEFELPGGKLEIDENPIQCLKREIKEELNIVVRVGQIIDSWLYHINADTHVVIITYCCYIEDENPIVKISNEHKEFKSVDINEIDGLLLPGGYRLSIKKFMTMN